MSQITQHQAAEMWELCRDHAVAGAKMRLLSASCRDPQLRNTVERHANEFQQATQRLIHFLQDAGNYVGTWPGQAMNWHSPSQPAWRTTSSAQWQVMQPSGMNQTAGSAIPGMFGGQEFDIAVATDCLRVCKTFAVQCIWGATESAEPARSYLYQLAGEHLRMAQEHYHWLEQRGAYASPRADASAIQDYVQKLQQITRIGQAVANQGPVAAGVGQPVGTLASGTTGTGSSYGGYQGASWGGGAGQAHPTHASYGYAGQPAFARS